MVDALRKAYAVIGVTAVVLTVVFVWSIGIPHTRTPPTIPPGETRGLVSTCAFNGGASFVRLRLTIDSVEVGNVTVGRRDFQCASSLVDPGSHAVSVTCDSDGGHQSWSYQVEIASRQVVELPGEGQTYSCV